MKQRITADELMELTSNQRQNLRALWLPRKYDLVLANICTDVEKEEFRQIEFIVGSVGVFGTNIYLWDIRAIKDINEAENETGDSENDNDHDYNNKNDNFAESASVAESNDTDELMENDNYDLVYYNKDVCLPLLSIGQMIDILRKNHYGEVYFYISISTGEDDCGLGRDGGARDYEGEELCDVLWESIKEIL